MGCSSVNEVSTSGWTNESDNEGEVGLEQFPGFLGELVSYPPGSDAFREFCKAKAAIGGKWGNCVEFTGHTWNDSIIWMKGNFLQGDNDEPLDFWFRTLKQSVKSTVERKESLLAKVVEEETELKLVLEGLGLSRKKRVDIFTGLGRHETGEVAKEKRRRAKSSGEKVAEVRPAVVNDLREVEERARLAALHGEEDTSKTVACHMKGIWLGIEEEKSELMKANSELEIELARAKTEAMKEVRQLKASQVVAISQLQVDTIKADTYVEEEDEEEAEAVGVVDGLDGVSRQTVLDSQGDDVELPEGCSEKVVREMSLRINDLESGLARKRETSKALLSAIELERMRQKWVEKDNELRVARENLSTSEAVAKHLQTTLPTKDMEFREIQQRCDDLNERVARLKAEKDQSIVCVKKAKAREYSGGSRTEGHVQKGNVNLWDCQHKLDVALIREKIQEGEIKAKKLLAKKKEELLKGLPAREELNADIGKLRARVVDLEALNLAESMKYIAKLEEDAIYHDKVDAKIIEWKNDYARLKSRLERLKVRFTTMVVPDTSRSDLLRVIIAYFVEEVKRLESE
ncbi:hypothetical protein GIB67_030105 [Kingdonia uniflora]|uniref:Uncharacterized protein n=1 Tax=Kingdonia uniflora TaxID=39325 RepID=A0A7J7L2E9_9MAGN|nr:hypothetical protein GIB67_030105 [Kingdonia uniflora]